MNIFRRLSFEWWYMYRQLPFNWRYMRRPPWETGVVPPEVEDYIASHPAGHALDLGCGSGTSSLALARAGWIVCGVDYSRGAIHLAQQKASLAGLDVDFQRRDVSRLPPSIFTRTYDLILDIGCFHGLTGAEKRSYLQALDRLLAPGGTWLVYGFFTQHEYPSSGLEVGGSGDIGNRIKLIWRKDGLEKNSHPSAWFCYQAGSSK
jgi:cyclopropane fatty-acyl-phospholipid synthase-like methyltransferase